MQQPANFTFKNYVAFSTEPGLLRTLTTLFVIGAMLILWVVATITMRPLSIPDEGRYVGVAWEMVRSGLWLTPTLDGMPYFHKPPLFYWITAAALTLFGNHEWAARLAPLTGALIAALSIFSLMQRWTTNDAARLSVLILATSPFFYSGAQFANHDMLVAGFITATITFAAHAILSMQNGQPYRLALSVAWASAALGLLSKGLIGIVLPGGVIICWLLTEGNFRALIRLCWWPGLMLFAMIAVPWFAIMEIKHAGFLYYFFIEQQFQRFVGTGFNNRQPFWFLPIVLIVLNLPWIVFLYTRIKLPSEKNLRIISLRRLLWIWLLLILIFFSIPQSKLIGYGLPVLPALAALIAEGLAAHAWWVGNKNLSRTCTVFVAGLLCVMAIAGIAIHDKKSSRQLAHLYLQKARPQEGIVFFNVYPFDMAFYTQLKLPVVVIDDWDRSDYANIDSWRKELLEAGKFATEKSKYVLQPYSALPALLCKNPVTWIFSALSEVNIHTDLQKAEIMGENKQYLLLRLSRSFIDCKENS